MASATDFCLLGPLVVRSGGVLVPVRRGKQRAVLAALLLSAGKMVSLDELAEILWGPEPPPSARVTIQNYVMRLRRALADAGGQRISTQPHGYLIRVDAGELDVTRFEALLGAAREAARDNAWDAAAARSGAALSLWRGEPLSDVDSEVLAAREVPRLAELRLQALEVRIDADVRLGRRAEVLAELRQLVAGHPLREHLHGLLMLALYRDGRQGEALAAYRDARRVLVEELGTEPGTWLRELHRQILTADPALTAPPPGRPAPAGTATAMHTLPRDIASFTGRTSELARLARAAEEPGGVVGIRAIGGMAGVGKTALAVHAAYRLAPQFPGGQLFLALHGHTPGHRPVRPSDALASLLLAAGIPVAQIPPGLAERAGLWRDHLAGRRILLVLDDAIGSEQVEPLLPGSGGSLVLVTSRRHLTALADAEVISLDVLPPEEAAALLVRLAGRPALRPGDAAVAEICRLCGYLPLAIGMLGRRLHHHPVWTAAELAAELAAARDRLELMAAEDVSVTAGFDLSYAGLDGRRQQLFRRLGLHPGSDVDAYAAAALADCPLAAARAGLAALYDHHLLTEPSAGRYRLHDLLREHAAALARRDDPASDRGQALARLLDYYTHTATLAGTRMVAYPRPALSPPLMAPPAAVPALTGGPAAMAWARAERANLLACLNMVTGTGQHARVVALTAALTSLLRSDGPWTEAIARHTTAIQAAAWSGDRLGQAVALNNLGGARELAGDLRGAAQAQQAALSLFRDLGDRLGQAVALSSLGTVRRLSGDYRGAVQAMQAALDIHRDLGDLAGQANALSNLGAVRRLAGDYPAAAQALVAALSLSRDLGNQSGQAVALVNLGAVRRQTGDYHGASLALEEALSLFRGLGDRHGQANTLLNLGAIRRLTGDHRAAARALQAALDIHHDLGGRLGQANALLNLGAVHRLTGNHPSAARALAKALAIYRDLGDRGGEAEALNETGTLHRGCGDLDKAAACHRQAMDVARQIDGSWDEAHALAGLGRCALAGGHAAEATAWLTQAHRIFQRIGAAETTEIAAELDAVGRPR